MIILVMGVSGSGKSTVGRKLADRFGWPFYDGDDLHPPENIAKMSSGEPLTDEDRWPWLQRIGALMKSHADLDEGAVFACSALRRAYRQLLQEWAPDVQVVYLRGSHDEILSRMNSRAGHFMPADLLDSQLETLEEPLDAVVVDTGQPPDSVVDEVVRQLGL